MRIPFVLCRVLLLLCVSGVVCPAHAVKVRYVLNYLKQKEGVTIQVYDRKIKKVLWRRAFQRAQEFTWSADRTCLAAEVAGDNTGSFGLLTWRAGQNPRFWSKQAFFQDNDGIMEMRWSPDKRKLLLLTWAGGGSLDAGAGWIYVLDLYRDRFLLGPHGVRRVRWKNNRVIRFWEPDWKKETGISMPIAKSSHLLPYSALVPQ